MYRESVKLANFEDDWRLFKVAMEHSRKMASGMIKFSADSVGKGLRMYPFIDYFTDVTRFPSMNNAFTNAVNQWTTDNKVSRILLKEFNCAGVGVAVAENGDVYFTLILALRTVIGHSYYSGTTMRSVLLAQQCSRLLNKVRHDEFQLLPIHLDLKLCDMAYRFASMDAKELTNDYLKEKIIASFISIFITLLALVGSFYLKLTLDNIVPIGSFQKIEIKYQKRFIDLYIDKLEKVR